MTILRQERSSSVLKTSNDESKNESGKLLRVCDFVLKNLIVTLTLCRVLLTLTFSVIIIYAFCIQKWVKGGKIGVSNHETHKSWNHEGIKRKWSERKIFFYLLFCCLLRSFRVRVGSLGMKNLLRWQIICG